MAECDEKFDKAGGGSGNGQPDKGSGSRKSNGKRSRGKRGRGGKSGSGKQDGLRSSTNDPSWYATDPNIMRDAASFPFSWAAGTPVSYDITKPDGTALPPWTVPGIQVQYLVPSVGYSDNANAPINIAATATYSFVRHANSGHANYDAPDLMIMMMAMGSAYSYINFLQRIYGMSMVYSQRNRYIPRALIEAQGVDFDDVYGNLANFRYGINVLINKVSSLSVPATMSWFKRHAFLYQNYYTEGTSVKDQMYMYSPAAFWQFGYDSNQAGMLKLLEFVNPSVSGFPTVKKTVAQLLAYGNQLIDPLIADEDINIMSGDILKAYAGNTIKLAPLAEMYTLYPVFDIRVLEQMKNATVFTDLTTNSGNVTQVVQVNNSYLQFKPTTSGSSAGKKSMQGCIYAGNRVLTTTTAEVDPSLVMENTRMMAAAKWTGSAGTMLAIYAGSEIVVGNRQFRYAYTDDTTYTLSSAMFRYASFYELDPANANMAAAILGNVARLAHFKFHPCAFVSVYEANSVAGQPDIYGSVEVNYDVDNYAVVTPDMLIRLHEAAILNMLHVNAVSKLGGERS